MNAIFSFSQNPSKNPQDLILDVTSGIELMLCLLSSAEDISLTSDGLAGFCNLLRGFTGTLDSALCLISHEQRTPEFQRDEAYQDGYKRGSKEGREAFINECSMRMPGFAYLVREIAQKMDTEAVPC